MSRTHISNNEDPTFSAKARSSREIIQRVSKYLKPYKRMAVGTIACAILSLASAFVFPKATGFIIDDVISQGKHHLLLPTVGALIGAFFLRDLFNSIRIRINNVFEQCVIYDMRREVYGKLQRLPIAYFDQRSSGDLMTRVIEDVNAVERLLIDGTEQGVVAILSVVGVLAFMVLADPMLAVVALIPIPLLAAGALWYTLTAHKRYRIQRKAASAMNALLMDNLQGVRAIKAFGREPHEDVRFAQRAEDVRQGSLVVMRAWAYYSPAMTFCTGLGAALVLWIGGGLVIKGEMKLGELTSFLLFLAFFYEPISKLHGLNQMLQSARAAGERVFDILDYIEERDQRSQVKSSGLGLLPKPVRGDVVYENVTFSYGPDSVVLKNINLHAKPGEMIALVGPTGAGKSTLVNLLPAFYLGTSGRITIDGMDLNKISLESLRSEISVVSQEAFLFNGTIRENILYGNLNATEDELIDAAKAANCHDFIMRLPDGYDARVGERGVKLSVGEKQRVSIARALLKDSPILILDEATASVDTATEKLIQEALERLMKNRTSFVIAHRLSTVRNADQILVLRQGEIIERGTHDELILGGGLYAKLAKVQNTSLIEEGFEKLSVAE